MRQYKTTVELFGSLKLRTRSVIEQSLCAPTVVQTDGAHVQVDEASLAQLDKPKADTMLDSGTRSEKLEVDGKDRALGSLEKTNPLQTRTKKATKEGPEKKVTKEGQTNKKATKERKTQHTSFYVKP